MSVGTVCLCEGTAAFYCSPLMFKLFSLSICSRASQLHKLPRALLPGCVQAGSYTALVCVCVRDGYTERPARVFTNTRSIYSTITHAEQNYFRLSLHQ